MSQLVAHHDAPGGAAATQPEYTEYADFNNKIVCSLYISAAIIKKNIALKIMLSKEFSMIKTVHYSGYSRYQFWNFDKNTPECRTRLTIDITTSIETNFGVHLPLPLFTF